MRGGLFFSGKGRRLLFAMLFVFCIHEGFATDGALIHGLHYQVGVHAGWYVPHSERLQPLRRDPVRSFSLDVYWREGGGSRPDNALSGGGYFFSNLGNNHVFGSFHALFLSMPNPVLPLRLPFESHVRLGVAYVTHKFDPHRNPLNIAIASHLNLYGQMSFTARISLGERGWSFRPGLALHHLSNGNVSEPNRGLNLLTFRAGVDVGPAPIVSGRKPPMTKRNPETNHRFSIVGTLGVKQAHEFVPERIMASSLILDYGYRLFEQIRLGLGGAIFYNNTWAYEPYPHRDESLSPLQAAVHLSVQRDMGPLAFFLHPGTYIRFPAGRLPFFTGRLGVRYLITDHLRLQFSVKHHWFALADHFEWGVGYEWNR